jgi:hypothetical protein
MLPIFKYLYSPMNLNDKFLSKPQLIEHYEKTIGAIHFGGRIMIIETKAALKLIDKYF